MADPTQSPAAPAAAHEQHEEPMAAPAPADTPITPNALAKWLPLLLSVAGFSLLFGAIVLMRMRAALAEQAVAARSRRIAAAHA